MSKNVSRRAMLAAASVAIPVATAGATPLGSADAELLALGAQLNELEKEWRLFNVIPDESYEQTRADAVLDREDALVWDILSHKADTVGGLAVQTKAITMAAAELWGELENTHERAFIEAVCAFVGVPKPEQSPSPIDPIVAAIAAHRTAWAALSAECSHLDVQNTSEANARLDELQDAVTEAEDCLIKTEPATKAGLSELSRYVAAHEARGDSWSDWKAIHQNIAQSIKRLA
jgi:hypothetical protein